MLPISKKHCRVASEKTSCVSKPPPTFVLPTQNIFVPRNEDDFEIVLDCIAKGHLKTFKIISPASSPPHPLTHMVCLSLTKNASQLNASNAVLELSLGDW